MKLYHLITIHQARFSSILPNVSLLLSISNESKMMRAGAVVCSGYDRQLYEHLNFFNVQQNNSLQGCKCCVLRCGVLDNHE